MSLSRYLSAWANISMSSVLLFQNNIVERHLVFPKMYFPERGGQALFTSHVYQLTCEGKGGVIRSCSVKPCVWASTEIIYAWQGSRIFKETRTQPSTDVSRYTTRGPIHAALTYTSLVVRCHEVGLAWGSRRGERSALTRNHHIPKSHLSGLYDGKLAVSL